MATSERKRVVVTGACGYVASLMLPELREKYELVLLDVVSGEAAPATAGLTVHVADLTSPNLDAYRHHFAGAHAVIHLGRLRSPDGLAGALSGPTWDSEHANVVMAHNVYQVAMEEGVCRAVVASSNHAADFYEPLIHDGSWDHVRPDTYSCGARPLADNLYGWAKEAYEHLGFLYAVGKGSPRQLEVVQVRIGNPRDNGLDDLSIPGASGAVDALQAMNRYLGAYISARDCTQLFVKSIETPDIRDEHGVPFLTVYGISGNDNAFWSLSNARRVLGYEPEDNSLHRFSEQIAQIVSANTSSGKL